MQYIRYYKTIFLVMFFCMLSCDLNFDNSLETYDLNSSQTVYYRFKLKEKDIELIIKQNSDTVYLHKYIYGKETYEPVGINTINSNENIKIDTIYGQVQVPTIQEQKIPSKKSTIEEIKKVITDHLKIEKFLLNRPKANEGMTVRFNISIMPNGSSWNTIYWNIGKYEDISLDFKRLIDNLIKEDERFSVMGR